MSQLNVLFEVPKYLEAGIKSGLFERVGGVIVKSGSRQVVAWLRDGAGQTLTNQASKIATSAFNPINFVFTIAQTAATLLDGHATRGAIQGVSEQVQNVASLTMLTASGQVINLAFSALTFRTILKRIDALSTDIDNLSKEMRLEFKKDRDMEFKVAFQAARDAIETKQATTRETAVRSAIDGLFKAQKTFFREFEESMSKVKTDKRHLPLAHQHLISAAYALISRVRCYAVTGDMDIAKRRFKEELPQFRIYAESLINACLGENPALYFHSAIDEDRLDRFLQVQRWLLETPSNDKRWLFKAVDKFRGEFWNEAINPERDRSPIAVLNRFMPNDIKNITDQMDDGLSQAEVVMENMDRLRGFELELSTMRLSMEDWNDLVSVQDLEKHGGAIIVDPEIAARYARLGA